MYDSPLAELDKHRHDLEKADDRFIQEQHRQKADIMATQEEEAKWKQGLIGFYGHDYGPVWVIFILVPIFVA